MSKRYNIEQVINNKWAIWYMETPNDKRKLGVWKVIDLTSGTRLTKYAFRLRVKGKEKTQEQLDGQIIANLIKNFYKDTRIYRGSQPVGAKSLSRVA